MNPFPTLGSDTDVHAVYPLVLGTVDVPRRVVHAGESDDFWTVPLIATLIVTPSGEPILVDNGFDADVIPRIPTPHALTPGALAGALGDHGLGYADVRTVVNTHLHADHAGMNKAFDRAEIYIQESEYAYATAATGVDSHGYRPRSAFSEVPQERFRFVTGHHELRPGLWLLHTPGHTPGHHAVAVHSAAGWLLLTGDACDDRPIWDGAARPGIVRDEGQFDASLAAMRDSGCVPLFPHDLAFTRDELRPAY